MVVWHVEQVVLGPERMCVERRMVRTSREAWAELYSLLPGWFPLGSTRLGVPVCLVVPCLPHVEAPGERGREPKLCRLTVRSAHRVRML